MIFSFLSRLFTGSFDKSLKIWSLDGKLIHKLDNFLGTVTSVCFIPRNKTIWVAAGASYAWMYDPVSGEDVCFMFSDNTFYSLAFLSLLIFSFLLRGIYCSFLDSLRSGEDAECFMFIDSRCLFLQHIPSTFFPVIGNQLIIFWWPQCILL